MIAPFWPFFEGFRASGGTTTGGRLKGASAPRYVSRVLNCEVLTHNAYLSLLHSTFLAFMSAQSQATPHDNHTKRRRETESQGSDPTALADPATRPESASSARPASSSQRPPISVKKRKDDSSHAATALRAKPAKGVTRSAAAGGPDEPITLSDGETSPIESDGDEGVSAVKASARTAAELAGVHSANARRARFAQRFSGLTLEETLGEFTLVPCSVVTLTRKIN